MDRLWSFVKDEENRKVLAWAGGGLAVVVGGLWAAYVHFSTPNNSDPPQPSVTASGCSVAMGRDVTGSTITAGNCPPEQKPAKP
jgi:hypothetical protein